MTIPRPNVPVDAMSTKDEIKVALKDGEKYKSTMTREDMQAMIKESRAIKPGTHFDFYDAVMKVRLLAQELTAQDVSPTGRMPHEASQLLCLAWMDCINLEAEAAMHRAGCDELMTEAKKQAREKHDSDECTPVSRTGPAMIVKVNGRDIPAPAYNMGGARPLWWLYAEMIKERADESQRDHGDVGRCAPLEPEG